MENSSLQRSIDSYVHCLEPHEIPSLPCITIPKDSYFKSSIVNGVSLKNPEPVGYIVVVDGYKIAAYEKPNPKHLYNMKKTFGWKWEDV